MNSSRRLINVSSRQLLAFLEISRLQSFAKAAERISISASGMSMLVKELEKQGIQFRFLATPQIESGALLWKGELVRGRPGWADLLC